MKFEDVEKARVALLKKRKQVRDKALKICVPIFIILIVIFLIKIFTSNNSTSIGAFVPIFPMLIVPVFIAMVVVSVAVSFATQKELVAYKRAYKAYFVSHQLEKFFTDIKYEHENGLEKEILKSTGMIHTGDVYYSNDLVCAKYKNVGFTQADVTIQDEHTDSDGDTYYVTVFKGRYMIFEFPKKFNFKMIVTSHYVPKFGLKLKKIETESTDFNKRFNVYAEDGFEAFYLLDPAFIASIENLGKIYNYKISFYFVENKLFIGINNGNDSFEPPKPNEPINEQSEIEKTSRDIKVVTDFVDELRLSRDKV